MDSVFKFVLYCWQQNMLVLFPCLSMTIFLQTCINRSWTSSIHDCLINQYICHPPLIRNFTKSWPSYHRTGAGAPSQQRTLTPPDTWSCPIKDLHLFLCWDHSFLNLPCLRTFWVSNIPRNFYFAIQKVPKMYHTHTCMSTNRTNLHVQ